MRSRSRSFFRGLRSLAWWCFWTGITVACFRNVFWDNKEIAQMATRAACEAKPGCYAQMTQMMRSPIGHSFRFVASGRPVEVECRRAFFLLGDYACKEKASSPAAPVTTSTPPSAAVPTTRTASTPRPSK